MPLPTLDEKFPDLVDLSVGAFIKRTGALRALVGGQKNADLC